MLWKIWKAVSSFCAFFFFFLQYSAEGIKGKTENHLLGHLQQGLVVALPFGPPLTGFTLQLFDLLGHLHRYPDTQQGTQVDQTKQLQVIHRILTFSISCLKVVKTSLLLARVLWNSSNLSMYKESWTKSKNTVHELLFSMKHQACGSMTWCRFFCVPIV